METEMTDNEKPAQMMPGYQTFVRDVAVSDLEKIYDALADACRFLRRRDEMNAVVHLARETRYSPLTATVAAAVERMQTIITTSARTDVKVAP
jgi:hypothetical protein